MSYGNTKTDHPMNYRTLFLIGSATLLSGALHAQLQRIVVQGTGAPQVFTDLAGAVAGAQANDVLYCSGGTYSIATSLVLDKPLHFIGAGIHPDSTQATGTTSFVMLGSDSKLSLTAAASGSTFTGIFFATGPISYAPLITYGTSSADDQVTNILFQRCRFSKGNVALAFDGNGSPMPGLVTTFDECHISGRIVGNKRGAVFTRCIIDSRDIGVYAINEFNGGSLLVENCVLLNALLGNCQFATVRNSISTAPNYLCFDCSGGNIINVVSASTTNWFYGGVASITNSVLGQDASTFFVSEADDLYQYSDDLRMAPGSPGINYGDDGNDVGIYGSSSPYKVGAIPFNPHYNQAVVAPATNSNGELPVNLRVAAQPH